MRPKKQKTLWVFDAETDPFVYGEIPKAFLWCVVSEHGDRYSFWGDECTSEFERWIMGLENDLLVAHNAGKFDAVMIKNILHGEMLIVDGRILKCSPKPGVEIRDSMGILPMPLKKLGAKMDIDLKKLKRDVREKHKSEIKKYCFNDCDVLLQAVQNFYTRAGGRRLTIASQASRELRAIYPDLPKLNEIHHQEFSRFFFGGRVQAFQKGIIRGDFKLYDVNSMYPSVMANCFHPYTGSYKCVDYSVKNMPENNCGFFIGTVDSKGCVPVRQKDKTTPYTIGRNLDVSITIHELQAGIDCGLISNIRGRLFIPNFSTRFDKFVLPHYASRQKAIAIKNSGMDLYHKLILNSSYGRFAMSPEDREEIYYAEKNEDISGMLFDEEGKKNWEKKDVDLDNHRLILGRPVSRPWLFYEDVATGASITGAARATMMRGIHATVNPLYCDTDSIMCEEFGGAIGDQLGEWKLECEFDVAAIAGKKMYTLLKNKRPVKSASKGVRACPSEIYIVADGDEVEIFNDAPVMRLNGTKFIARKIRMT